MVSVEDVRQLASDGRIAPHPSYHAHQQNVRFEEIVAGLHRCLRVDEDHREGHDGYVAWCPYKGTRTIRVDFEVQDRSDGALVLVVTAFEVN